ncbi:MAG: hypothetical protein C4297_07570 [Gemmataceae bacterium]
MVPYKSSQALDWYFLEARSKILDLAAILDRIERAGGMPDDLRVDKLREALRILADSRMQRVEEIQLVFSHPYDPHWQKR